MKFEFTVEILSKYTQGADVCPTQIFVKMRPNKVESDLLKRQTEVLGQEGAETSPNNRTCPFSPQKKGPQSPQKMRRGKYLHSTSTLF